MLPFTKEFFAKTVMKYVGAIGFYQTTGTKPVDERKIRDLYVWVK